MAYKYLCLLLEKYLADNITEYFSTPIDKLHLFQQINRIEWCEMEGCKRVSLCKYKYCKLCSSFNSNKFPIVVNKKIKKVLPDHALHNYNFKSPIRRNDKRLEEWYDVKYYVGYIIDYHCRWSDYNNCFIVSDELKNTFNVNKNLSYMDIANLVKENSVRVKFLHPNIFGD